MQPVKAYNTLPGLTLLSPPLPQNRPINRIAWSPDGNLIASPSESQAISLWDMHTAQRTHILTGHTGPVYCVAWSPDSRLLASGSSDRTIRLWDSNTGKTLRMFQRHTGTVYSLSWLHASNILASLFSRSRNEQGGQ